MARDAYDLWSRHQSKIEEEQEKLPKCCECDQPIEDDNCYKFENDLICPQCLNENHRRSTYEFMEEGA